jgi:hypothetical protein
MIVCHYALLHTASAAAILTQVVLTAVEQKYMNAAAMCGIVAISQAALLNLMLRLQHELAQLPNICITNLQRYLLWSLNTFTHFNRNLSSLHTMFKGTLHEHRSLLFYAQLP